MGGAIEAPGPDVSAMAARFVRLLCQSFSDDRA